MKDAMLGLMARTQNAMAKGEEGAFPADGGSVLWLIVAVLAIIALIIYIKPHFN